MPPSKHFTGAKQSGVVAIEFAMLFLIFFTVVYVCVSYALVMLLQQGLTQAAAEGARAGIGRVDRLQFTTDETYQAAADTLAQSAAASALSWLPEAARNRIIAEGIGTNWSSKTLQVKTGIGEQTIPITTPSLTVTVTYPDYAQAPLLPLLQLPGGISLPKVPTDLVGEATLTR